MARYEDMIDVDVPVSVAYDQWTQFETFPEFMDGIESVTQNDDRTLSWSAKILGRQKHWTATITDQTPDTRVAWKSVEGAMNAGAVLFESLGPDRTRVTLKLEVEPDGAVEAAGANLGLLERQVKDSLDGFKEFIENRREPTGAWRGEIHGKEVRSPQS